MGKVISRSPHPTTSSSYVMFAPFTSLTIFSGHNPTLTVSPASSSNHTHDFSTLDRSGYPVGSNAVTPTSSEFAVPSPDIDSLCPAALTVEQSVGIFYDNVVRSRGVGICSSCFSTDLLVLQSLLHMHSLNVAASSSVSELQYTIL